MLPRGPMEWHVLHLPGPQKICSPFSTLSPTPNLTEAPSPETRVIPAPNQMKRPMRNTVKNETLRAAMSR